jgi:hypothetical protein
LAGNLAGSFVSLREVALFSLIAGIWAAGVLHFLVASANFFAAHKFQYRQNLAQVTPVVRQVFIVQNVYIVLVLTALGLLCFGFAPDLAGRSLLGRLLSGFLAVFWGLRLLIQLFFYDTQLKKQHRFLNVVFLVAFGYLAGIFALAAGNGGG